MFTSMGVPQINPRLRRRSRGGFTLIEAAIVLVIIGVGVTGLVQLIGAGSMANSNSAELTTGIELANNINEMLQGVPYASLKSTYDDVVYNPPKDALGNDLTANFTGWQQSIDIKYVDPLYVASAVPDSQIEPTCRVTVAVSHRGQVVYTAEWLAVSPN